MPTYFYSSVHTKSVKSRFLIGKFTIVGFFSMKNSFFVKRLMWIIKYFGKVYILYFFLIAVTGSSKKVFPSNFFSN